MTTVSLRGFDILPFLLFSVAYRHMAQSEYINKTETRYQVRTINKSCMTFNNKDGVCIHCSTGVYLIVFSGPC